MTQKVLAGTLLATLLFSMTANAGQRGNTMPEPVKLVDINSAPMEDIESIVLNELLAKKIVDNRPYANKRQLVTRRLITLEQYEEIKDRIIARRGPQ